MDQIAWIIVASFVMPLLISIGFAWFVVQYQKRKNEYLLDKQRQETKEKELLLKHQRELENERNRIAAEMHDDLGGGLTLIKHLGRMVKRKIDKDPESQVLVEKIVNNSSTLISNMSEIIWAMNTDNDSLQGLIEYATRYGQGYTKNFDLDFIVENKMEDKERLIKSKFRRNVFLVVKECLHNIAKHAGAKTVRMVFSNGEGDRLNIMISDDGIGIDENIVSSGNGLRNMKMRIEDVGGNFEIRNNNGTHARISVPLPVMALEQLKGSMS